VVVLKVVPGTGQKWLGVPRFHTLCLALLFFAQKHKKPRGARLFAGRGEEGEKEENWIFWVHRSCF
jgi:hypothetical protein